MGLRCLLGHDFTEPEIEREREEQGAEVVTTVREVKTCARCGETQVVSENTEVTTIEQLADQATTAEAADAASADPSTTPDDSAVAVEGAESEATAQSDDPSVAGAGLDRDTGGRDDISTSDDTSIDDAVSVNDTPSVDSDSPVDDDAVIIDDTDADGSPSDQSVEPSSEHTVDPSTDRTASPPEVDDASGGLDDASGGLDEEDAELIDEGDTDDAGDSAGFTTDTEEPMPPSSDTVPADGDPADTAVGDRAADDVEGDDGVILDEEESTDGDREHGAWPTEDDSFDEQPDPTPWPEQRGEDEGYSAEPGGSEDNAAVEFGGSLTPEATDPATDTDPDTEYVEAPDDGVVTETEDAAVTTGSGTNTNEFDGADDTAGDPGSGITHGESPELERQPSNVASEYFCPECGMTMGTDGNSMRAGDICPECKRGYVDERPR